jgi:hypothetical protein
MHAVIEIASPEEITLIDLGNEPGTLVNDARVHKCKLNLGDRIRIGGTRILLERAERVVVAAAPFAGPFGVAPAGNPFGAPAPNPFTVVEATDPFALHNPFAPPPHSAHDEVPHDAPEGSYTYTLVKSAPDVPADEVEDHAASTVEVMILWDQAVLHVQHLSPPRSYYLGEEQDKAHKCDFFVPAEMLGATRAPVVLAERGGAVALAIPPRATGTIELPGQPKMTIAEAIQQGKTQPCAELADGRQMALPAGAKARIEVGGLTIQLAAGNAGRVVAGHTQLDTQSLLYAGISLAVHAGLLAAMAFFMPAIGATDEDGISADQQYTLQQMLQAAAQKELDEKPTEQAADAHADDKEGGTGTRANGEEGAMGSPNTKATGKRYGVQGPRDNPDPHIASREALADAGRFGIIGLLNSGAGGDLGAPTAPWGRDESLGNDPLSARGGMWGSDIGDSFGGGGLGLTGVGEGGGGRGEGIGLGTIGTLGHGSGLGGGQGIGSGHGQVRGAHRVAIPSVRPAGTTVSGRLPPEVIQRIVRQNFGRFRLCYENGLRNSPNLQGRVSVRFVIGRDGAVSNVANGGSDMPDGNVVSCVVRSFYGLSFPQPDGGIVTVTYPIMFSPGG